MLLGRLRRTREAVSAVAICVAWSSGACTSSSHETEPGAPAATAELGSSDGAEQPDQLPDPAPATEPAVQATPVRAPIEHRRAQRAMMLYTQPSFAAPFRGKISHGEVFGIVEPPQPTDERCRGEGWARIETAAFACLEHASPTDEVARDLPVLPPGRLVPFYYARMKPKRADGTNPPAPIWRSRASLRDGRPPIGQLEPAHVYAFESRSRMRGGAVLEAKRLGVVREADVKPQEPRDFEGRDLLQSPVPPGMVLAWTVAWPETLVRDEPNDGASVGGRLGYHEPLLLAGAPVERRGTTFHSLISPRQGWVDAADIRRWIPMDPPAGVEPDELWLDVELEQQTLTIMRGDGPEFVTLVSTGTWKDPTPVGLFRIGTKEAYGDMRSRAGDDDTYHVEAVPWVQYFHARYALHGAYWHGRYGRRTSHGCINLSPKDAARVFAATVPRLPPGWIMIYEHPEDLGTLIRIRKLTAEPPDRRTPPRERRASDYG